MTKPNMEVYSNILCVLTLILSLRCSAFQVWCKTCREDRLAEEPKGLQSFSLFESRKICSGLISFLLFNRQAE